MVKVKPTETKNKISVKTSIETNVFSIKDNLSEFYAKLAERWANSPDMVNGIDYSSKYYAEQSKASAQIASNVKSETQALVDGFDNNVQIAKDDIEQNRINSINAIDNTYSVAVGDMQEKSDEVLASIEASKDEAIDSINSTKTTILNDIEFIADGEKKEIEDLADEIKDSGNTVNTAIEAGIERLNSIDTLNKSQITNCLQEIPQRIKYTLENGTLAIKAGSVVIVPYGTEDKTSQYPVGSRFFHDNFKVYDTQYIPPQTPILNYTDGRFFVWVELQNDIKLTGAGQATGQCPLMLSITNNSLAFNDLAVTGSGDDHTADTTNYTYYDTTLNIVYKRSNASTDWFPDVWALPLATFTRNAGTITSIDQVFNGFGYIGSAVWLDKGVKFLISNGRNNDETLKNIEYTTENFYIAQNTSNNNITVYLTFTLDHIVGGKYYPIVWDGVYYVQVDKPSRTSCLWRNPATNYMYALRTGFEGGIIQSKAVVFGELTFTNGKITSLNTKQPFRAVDWYNFEESINDFEDFKQNIIDLEIGKPQISLDSNLPSGCVWLEGATVSRTTYANLFAIYSTTYGEGDGSTTFKLPDFRNRAIWGSNGFGYLSAGLPNITGAIRTGSYKKDSATASASGALSYGSYGSNADDFYGGSNNGYWYQTVNFNASKSNAIYGGSTTVQPPAIKVRVYTRYQ